MLDDGILRRHVAAFNAADEETVRQHVPNAAAAQWLNRNIPLFECPDREIEEIYYFRWWTYRKHVRETPEGFIVTEFLPDVGWSGAYNSIPCAAGHHIREGRWLRDRTYLNDYLSFWFRGRGNPRSYSTWIADALQGFCEVTGDFGIARGLRPDLVANYRAWEGENLHESGLFWSSDDRDGGELSVSGPGLRPTLNSYMYGEASAIGAIAAMSGRDDIAREFSRKASHIRDLVQERLWDPVGRFFKVIPLETRGTPVREWSFHSTDPARNVRELHGFTPWYFHLPGPGFEDAWSQINDPAGFAAPYGLTTAEQRHPGFAISYEGHECLWNGPVWPFMSSVALSALANCIRDHAPGCVTRGDFLGHLRTYAHAHHRVLGDGRTVPWIDENIHPFTGDWIARTRLSTWKDGGWCAEKGGYERGKDYNHSTFCDLVISGLVGILTSPGGAITVDPLVPDGAWDWFCLDGVACHGRTLTVLYDRTGERYARGKGLRVLVDGEERAGAPVLTALAVDVG
jgi:hypothetical protein